MEKCFNEAIVVTHTQGIEHPRLLSNQICICHSTHFVSTYLQGETYLRIENFAYAFNKNNDT
jgi:hypothetical protein